MSKVRFAAEEKATLTQLTDGMQRLHAVFEQG